MDYVIRNYVNIVPEKSIRKEKIISCIIEKLIHKGFEA